MRFADPFQHVVLDDFIDPAQVRAINAQWPSDWTKEDGRFNRKWSSNALPTAAKAIADAIGVALVEDAVGIAGLFPDPDLFGAGLHCIPAGGFLKMHVDFNGHPKGWHRRANVLIYLNEEWRPEWGGQLQLGLWGHSKRIDPIGGRCVIFETNDQTWHGHPEPLKCPEHIQRRSLALYYYTAEPPQGALHTTIYRKRA